MRLLCLSNGHGEDVIVCRILKVIQATAPTIELAALPIVGTGKAYQSLGIPLVGPVQAMPSGGFIYMDSRQLAKDVKSGLIQLTLNQFKAIKSWAKDGGMILAAGDIVPLLMAWWSGLPYAFVGTAKSEYQLQDESGVLSDLNWFEQLEHMLGAVYLPWERWLMRHSRCKAVYLRDRFTAESLRNFAIPALDLGNPMMDGLGSTHDHDYVDAASLAPYFLSPIPCPPTLPGSPPPSPPLTFLLLPGSRAPEAYANWQKILEIVAVLIRKYSARSLLFLGAIDSGLSLVPVVETLVARNWHRSQNTEPKIQYPQTVEVFTYQKAGLLLCQGAFNHCAQQADIAIALAGTATEQFVGLGKPAITTPGSGPQFNATFAKTQNHMLGCSVSLIHQPEEAITVVELLLSDPDYLQQIAQNGHQRMGQPGASQRIANHLLEVAARERL